MIDYQMRTGKRQVPLLAHCRALLLFFLSVSVPLTSIGDDTVCATVKIRIEQELTLNRQAFDAEMIIHNGLQATPLTDVAITVKFYDADMNPVLASSLPDSTNALFFIQEPRLDGISQLPDGQIAAASDAEIHWLIIPTLDAGPDASEYENAQGTLFYVGATLSYKISGADYETTVDNDYIYVKPMPELRLDYFLPDQVYGDDPLTPGVQEPVIPFSMGLRVMNIGHGWARDLAIESAQPRIVDNEHGLLVAYNIEASEVDEVASPISLQVNFDDLAPEGDASVARWIMTCSLSGTFTNFNASLSHADELGGTLTSLIDETNVVTHMLIHDVLVDLGNRDAVRDFLATDLKVYESDGINEPVSDVSSIASLVHDSGYQYTLSFSGATTGFVYAKTTSPFTDGMMIGQVVRSDGKTLSAHNAWLSKTQNGSEWNHYFNLFDPSAADYTYTIGFEADTNVNQAPVLGFVGDHTVVVGDEIAFTVSATDPDGTVPLLTVDSIPVGAGFTDNGDGTAVFSWTPSTGQEGEYRVKFTAFDGALADTERISLFVLEEGAGDYGPVWWITRNVFDSSTPVTNDYAAVNQGQVKWMVTNAYDELESVLDGGAGTNIQSLVCGFNNADNYRAVNVGQLKAVSAPFYDRLDLPYPWEGSAETNDHAIANVGQLKNLFNFNPGESP